MPHIALDVEHYANVAVPTSGGTVYLPQRRIRTWGYFGSERRTRQAVIDTGAPAYILPARVWTKLDPLGDIAWVGGTNPRSGLPVVTVFGGRFRFRLGRVRLELVNVGSVGLGPRDVAVVCTDDPQTVPPHRQLPILIGLADVMHGRTLQLDASADGQRWAATLTEP